MAAAWSLKKMPSLKKSLLIVLHVYRVAVTAAEERLDEVQAQGLSSLYDIQQVKQFQK